MNLKPILMMSLMFVVAPMWIGTIWTTALGEKGRASRILHAWVLGFATMLAAAQLVFVPMVALSKKLSEAQAVWEFCMQALAVAAFLVFLIKRGRRLFLGEDMQQAECVRSGKTSGANVPETDREHGAAKAYRIIFGILAAVLILLQAYIPARYEHSDDDDARFIAEAVSAVGHDSMYQDSPIDADFMYWDVGEVRKDLTSPWAMFLAMQSNVCGFAPAVLAHSYLPFFLILLCYGVYALIGGALFRGDDEKTALFLIFLSVLHLFGYTSTHTLASMLLLRIWQGKAVCASFLLPLFFYLFVRLAQEKGRPVWIAPLYAVATGACLLSGIGIVTAPLVLFLYGCLDFCYHRKWKRMAAVWGAALPCAVFLGYYLFGGR